MQVEQTLDVAVGILLWSTLPFLVAMALIQQLLSIAPPFVFATWFPLVILLSLLLAFGQWFPAKWQTVGQIYGFSLLLLPLIDALTTWSELQIALTCGIAVPLVAGLLLTLRGLLQTLHLPQGKRVGWQALQRPSRRFYQRCLRSGIGSGVGGILGMAIGVTLSLLALALFSLLAWFPALEDGTRSIDALVAAMLDTGVYGCGGAGLVLGGVIGAGGLRGIQISDRILISLVIYSAMISLQFKKLLHIPQLNRLWHQFHPPQKHPSRDVPIAVGVTGAMEQWQPTKVSRLLHSERVQVTVWDNLLMLRHRTYRTGDWVWMGFNGLYGGFALLLTGIAVVRDTWTMMSVMLGVILLLAVLWTWHTLTRLCNYTTIALTPLRLTRKDAPLLSWTVPVQIPLEKIVRVKAATVTKQHSRYLQPMPEYRVSVLLVNGREIPLLRHLERWEDALFVEESIDQFRSQHGF